MRTYRLAIATSFLLVFAGCNSSVNPTSKIADTSRTPLQLGDQIDVSLKDLLAKPRKELAELGNACRSRIDFQDRALREGRLEYRLLPRLRLPLVTPIWRDPRYSPQLGFSLPSYAAEDARSSVLAFHLARFGDGEAAEKLIETTDAPALRAVLAQAAERSYPAEWTMLAGLLLHAAEMRLAAGEADGATELVLLHRQLGAVLDPKAAKGTLGAELLTRGYDLLTQAASAWRAEHQTILADQIESALKNWGPRPEPPATPLFGSPRTEVARVLGEGGSGRAIILTPPVRALDLFNLPFPAESAEAYIAFFDDTDRLTEAWLTYGESARSRFFEPAHLAYRLSPESVSGPADSQASRPSQHTYKAAGFDCDLRFPPLGTGVGAIVQMRGNTQGPFTVSLSRDFGDANLERSFEQNRLRLAPNVRADVLTVNRPEILAKVVNPLGQLKPAQATLRRHKKHDVADALSLCYQPVATQALHTLISHLWQTAGPAEIQTVHATNGSYLAFEWHDPRTRYSVHLPFANSEPVVFTVADAQGAGKQAERAAAAQTFDGRERAARLGAGKPFSRIARAHEQFRLGMARSEVERLLPTGQKALRRDMPDGVTIILLDDPADATGYVLRQLFVRFDKSNRLVEMRFRYYVEAQTGKPDWAAGMLNDLKKTAGAPLEQPGFWTKALADLPQQKPAPVCFAWHDDITALTYQADANGVELCFRDCPADHPEGAPLPPLEYLSRGSGDCLLGMRRAELLHRWNIERPTTTPDGALVLQPVAPRAYDALLVWFENDRVSRIVARHEADNVKRITPSHWAQFVSFTWRRELQQLGWPRRYDVTRSEVLQGLTWYDERTRVSIFWQENNEGSVRLFTEWKSLE